MTRQPPVSIASLRHRYLEPNFTAILPGVCQVSSDIRNSPSPDI
jgi:hypothetical protein